jgi:Peptidase A4 family
MTVRPMRVFVVLTLLAFLLLVPSLTALLSSSVAASQGVSPALGVVPPAKPIKQICPDCWSGYTLGSDIFGRVTGVYANLTIPKVSCDKETSASAFLVTLDGFTYDDYSLAAVVVNCAGGPPAWHAEWYNGADGSSGVSTWAPKTGDNVLLNVSEISGTVYFSIADSKQQKTLTGNGSDTNMQLDYSSCITDMLTNEHTGEVYPQADFRAVNFTDCTATVLGKTKPIGGFGSEQGSLSLYEYITYNSNFTMALNKVGKLIDKENFKVTFEAAGP